MRKAWSQMFRSFMTEEDGASRLEIGAAVLAALAVGIWFIVLVDTLI